MTANQASENNCTEPHLHAKKKKRDEIILSFSVPSNTVGTHGLSRDGVAGRYTRDRPFFYEKHTYVCVRSAVYMYIETERVFRKRVLHQHRDQATIQWKSRRKGTREQRQAPPAIDSRVS